MIARRGAWAAIAVAMLIGLALRIATARGGLWLDEAWSARYVAQAGDAVGVVWRINHDNNHILNSWWMLLVGPYAPPMMVRTLSIASGVASVAIAGAIGLRRSPARGIIAALLFAVSPILVAYGAEARGYGPMMPIVLLSILTIDRWLKDGGPAPVWTLGGLTLVGLLAQFTYVFALAAFGGWIVFTLARRMPAEAAVRTGVRVLAPSLGAVMLVVAVVASAARTSATGFQVGGYVDFTAAAFATGLADMIVYTLGLSFGAPVATIAAALVAVVAAILGARGAQDRRYLYVFALLAFPAMIALSRIGNTGFARYYIVASIVSLLLVADVAGAAIARSGWRRSVAIGFVVIVVVASLTRDGALATALRGDPARAIAAMRAEAPAGTGVGVDTIRPTAVLQAAARTAGYRLEIRTGCPAAAFAFVDLADRAAAPADLDRCGRQYARTAVGRYLALSGFDWALYARIPPQNANISRR